MKNDLELDRVRRQAETARRRKHFLFTVKEQLKLLSDSQLLALARECLHRNHYPALEEWVTISNKLVHLQRQERFTKKELGRLTYLTKMYRKTIQCILVSAEPDGYSTEVVEWLLINNYWRIEHD